MRELTTTEIGTFTREKQQLEITLAWELLDVFDDKPDSWGLLPLLRTIALNSLTAVDQAAKGSRGAEFRHKWKTDWTRKYFGFGWEAKPSGFGTAARPGVGGAPAIPARGPNYAKPGRRGEGGAPAIPARNDSWNRSEVEKGIKSFSAQQCGDWIRIVGEMVEEKFIPGDDARLAMQRGGKSHWDKYDSRYRDEPNKKGKVLGEQLSSRRRRVMGGGTGKETVMPDYAKETAHATLQRQQRVGATATTKAPLPTATTWGFVKDLTRAAGLNRWQVMAGDTTGKMDQVFGLMPGATISGTTTDNVFFFRTFGRLGMNPILFLLPAAAIVACGHHSLLEVGLPLMLNDVNNYRPGLYSTLFPINSCAAGAPAGVAKIKQTLLRYEHAQANRLMMLYYSGGRPAGGWLFDQPKDKFMWSRMLTGNHLMSVFAALRPFPDEERVRTLMAQLRLH